MMAFVPAGAEFGLGKTKFLYEGGTDDIQLYQPFNPIFVKYFIT